MLFRSGEAASIRLSDLQRLERLGWRLDRLVSDLFDSMLVEHQSVSLQRMPLDLKRMLPVLLQQINLRSTSQVRATVLSLANMGVSFGYVLIGPVFGRLSDRLPLGYCFLFLSLIYLIFTLVLLSTIRRHWHLRHG